MNKWIKSGIKQLCEEKKLQCKMYQEKIKNMSGGDRFIIDPDTKTLMK
jgi:hypothetical protein